MRLEIPGMVAALIIGLAPQPSRAADVVHADAIVHVTRVQPTHQLVEQDRVVLPYGNAAGAIGFEPAGQDRQAVGPSAFDVDGQGRYVVADPVHRVLVRVALRSGVPVVSPLGELPLPLSDLAVGRDGFVYLTDLRSRSLTTITPSSTSRTKLPDSGPGLRFVRHGEDVVMGVGRSRSMLRRGALTPFASSAQVEKCNAEAGLITTAFDARRIQVELGGPLASIRLIGVNATGDTFVLVERFRQRGRLAVDRQVVVLDSTGALKALLPVHGEPAVHPVRELVLGPGGALHRMVPGTGGVTFQRWEVRP